MNCVQVPPTRSRSFKLTVTEFESRLSQHQILFGARDLSIQSYETVRPVS